MTPRGKDGAARKVGDRKHRWRVTIIRKKLVKEKKVI